MNFLSTCRNPNTTTCINIHLSLCVSCTWRVKSSADACGMVLYICPSISLSWDTMGAKSCRRVFTDFSKMAHTAWERESAKLNLSCTQILLPYWGDAEKGAWDESYLHNLRVIQPFTEDRLYQCKDLLEHHHHLKHTKHTTVHLWHMEMSASVWPRRAGRCLQGWGLSEAGLIWRVGHSLLTPPPVWWCPAWWRDWTADRGCE